MRLSYFILIVGLSLLFAGEAFARLSGGPV
jgi:hypothetical protein